MRAGPATLIALVATFISAGSAAAATCQVTVPNESQPPPGGGGIAEGSLKTHGNGLLWTILPEDGVLRVDESAVRPDGSIVTKFVWWRRPLEVVQTTVAGVETFTTQFAGELVIAGTLVGSGGSLTATTREEGVHVGSTVRFPDGGCWHITGTAGEDALSFTVFVLPPGEPLPSTSMPPPANPMLAIGSMALVLATAAAVRSAWGPNTVTRVRARP